MNKNFYPSLILLALLAGCSHLKPVSVDTKPAHADKSKVQGEQPADVFATETIKRPHTELTDELLYSLLAGEMAGQQQKFDESVRYYLVAALGSGDWAIAKRATQIALFSGRLNEAAVAARRWVELAPTDPDAQKTMALIELRMNRTQSSADMFKKLLNRKGLPLDKAVPSVASLLIQETNARGALKVMDEIAKAYPQLPESWFSYGQLAAAKNDNETALMAAEKAIALKPDWPSAQAFYGEMLVRNDRLEDGLEHLEKQSRKYSKESLVGITYARALLKAGDLAAAKKQFARLEKNDPENPDVLFALALLHVGDNDVVQARPYLERLLDQGQYPNEANFYLGRITQQEKHFDKALGYFASVRSGKYLWEAQLATVDVLVDSGDADKARKLLQYLRTEYPNMQAALSLREGELLFRLKRYQEAFDFYTAEMKTAADPSDLLYGRSLVSEKLNRLDLVEQDLRAVLQKNPKNAQALNALGYTLADRTDRYMEALRLIEQAYALLPNDPAVLDSMGWIQYRLGKLEEAEKYLRQAFGLSQDAEIASHLGEVLWKRGKYQEARTFWEGALKDDPANQRVKDFLQQAVPKE